TYDPFSGQMVFTGEAGDSISGDTLTPTAAQIAYGGVYATPLNWSSTTPPAVIHSSLQGAMGHAGFEGIQLNDLGDLMIVEDTSGPTVSSGIKKGNGYVYRFIPTDPSDLTAGKLQALKVSIDGTAQEYSNQDPVAGTRDQRLYGGESFPAQWITIHDTG